MITIRAINGSPEMIPNTIYGSHFDGDNFYFFETEQELSDHKLTIDSQAGNDPNLSTPFSDSELIASFNRLKELKII